MCGLECGCGTSHGESAARGGAATETTSLKNRQHFLDWKKILGTSRASRVINDYRIFIIDYH